MVGAVLKRLDDLLDREDVDGEDSSNDETGLSPVDYRLLRHLVRESLLDWTRFFLKYREGTRFILSPHHKAIANALDRVLSGEITRLIINLPPGSTKTELAVLGFISRGLALNPRARFIHTSASDDLALRNSTATRDVVESEPFRTMFPGMKIRDDVASKKQWTTTAGGGLYAVATGGTVIGFRAGRMESGFQGALIIDDPIKPDDVFSACKRSRVNERFNHTVRTRLATPETPIIVIMQRLHSDDLSGFLLGGGSGESWFHLELPVVIAADPDPYPSDFTHGRPIPVDLPVGSLWSYKFPPEEVEKLRSDRFTFAAQYMQRPTGDGGGLFSLDWFKYYQSYDPRSGSVTLRSGEVVEIVSKTIYSDTASKTGELNDYSVFQIWGLGKDSRIYLLDLVRGKWEFHSLRERFVKFSERHEYRRDEVAVGIRARRIEDASSGVALIQELNRLKGPTYAEGIKRDRDKVSRARSATIHFSEGRVVIPADMIWTDEFLSEFRDFSPLMTHKHDDQVDPTLDAIEDLLSRPSTANRYAVLVGERRK